MTCDHRKLTDLVLGETALCPTCGQWIHLVRVARDQLVVDDRHDAAVELALLERLRRMIDEQFPPRFVAGADVADTDPTDSPPLSGRVIIHPPIVDSGSDWPDGRDFDCCIEAVSSNHGVDALADDYVEHENDPALDEPIDGDGCHASGLGQCYPECRDR